MRCPTCQQPTGSDQRWCAGCGAPLMFLDERAPAPLDQPLDLDRRWRARAEPPAAPPPIPAAPAHAAEAHLATDTPPPWWRDASAPEASPVGAAVVLTPAPFAIAADAPDLPHPPAAAEPEQMPLVALDAAPRAAAARRLLAAAIDVALVAGAGALPIFLAVRPAAAAGTPLAACAGFLALLGFTYATLGHALMGATIGKRALGLRVEGPDGSAPGLARSVARSALTVAGAAALGVGIVIGLLSRQGRALHDLAVGTSVVRVPVTRAP